MANKGVYMNKYLQEILKEMCKRVGADFKKIDVKKDRWYTEYSWTEAEEKEFKKWMVNYLKTNKKALNELYGRNRVTTAWAKSATEWFLFNYGWISSSTKGGAHNNDQG
jgi:hypothetical protein